MSSKLYLREKTGIVQKRAVLVRFGVMTAFLACFVVAATILLAGTAVAADPPTVLSITPVTTSSVMNGNTIQYNIVADAFPSGLSGYDLTLTVDDATIGTITGVSFPSPTWDGSINSGSSGTPGSSIRINAVDLNTQVQSGATNVVLATITVKGKKIGSAHLVLSSVRMDNDAGGSIVSTLNQGTLTVTPLLAIFPGCASLPRDLLSNGQYMDINGNGRLDFADVVLYYQNFNSGWMAAHEDVAPFDYDATPGFDFQDIVTLYQAVVA
jgi:large repetitive protein